MPVIDGILSFIAPHNCVGCAAEGKIICANCTEALPRIPSRCYMCQTATDDSRVCSRCHRKSKIKSLWVFTEYSNEAEKLVGRFKFSYARAAHVPIAECISAALPYGYRPDLIVPVPTATDRMRQRGFDHGRLMATLIASQLSSIYVQPIVRLGQTRQVGAGRKQRFEQMQNELAASGKHSLGGKRLLLVDDVVTTGATLETMAGILKEQGAQEICAAVFAQKI